jgi:hypothetical protein
MRVRVARQVVIFGFALAALSIAPAPQEKAPKRSALAEARLKAALKQYDETWTFYKQSRTGSFPVYYWSRLVLDSQRDLATNKAERAAALEAHLARMNELEALVKKVRKLGFGFSIDVGASEYYRIEAQVWLEKANEG